jgi:hypothetical protein
MRSYIASIRTLVLPSGATTGARIVLDGVNGRILIYNAANELVEQIDSAGMILYHQSDNSYINLQNNGPFIKVRPPDIPTKPIASAAIEEGIIWGSSGTSSTEFVSLLLWSPKFTGLERATITMTGQSFDTTIAPAVTMRAGTGDNFNLEVDGLVRIERLGVAAAFRVAITGEASQRFEIASTGTLNWGSGAIAPDTNLFRSAADILKTNDSFEIGTTLRIVGGANASIGRATLVAGTVTVNNTKVTAASNIMLTCQTPGGAPGFLRISARVVGTSFTILSSSATDTSVVAWHLIESV